MRYGPTVFLLLFAPFAAHAAPVKVAVYDFTTAGLPERTASVVTEAMTAELRKYEGLQVLGISEVRAMLDHERNRQMVGCTDVDTSCLTEIGGAMGVDQIVLGQVGQLGTSTVLTVKRVAVSSARIEGTDTRQVPAADGQELLSLVEPAVRALFPERRLRAGVEAGVNPQMVALLNPPPLPTWVPATTAGVGAAFGIVGIVAWAGALGVVSEGNAYIDGRVRQGLELEGGVLASFEARRQAGQDTALTLAGVATTFAVATAIELLFTDWHGYREWAPGRPAPRSLR